MTAKCQCGGTLERHFVEYATIDYDCMAKCDKCGKIFYPWYVSYVCSWWGGFVSEPYNTLEDANKWFEHNDDQLAYSGIVGFYTYESALDYSKYGSAM